MRVPTYERQTKATSQVGSQMMRVQASPGGLSAGTSAMTQFANTAFKVTSAFYEMEKKAERAAQSSSLISEANRKYQNLVINSQNTRYKTVDEASNVYDDAAGIIQSQTLAGIKDPRVKTTVAAELSTLAETNRLSFLKTQRTNIYDFNTAVLLERADDLKKQIATGTKSQVNSATNQLFENFDNSGVGLYEYMSQLGYIKDVDAVKYNISAAGDIDEITVNQELNAAAQSGRSADADLVLQKLLDPSQFSDLQPETRNALTSKANALSERLFSRFVTQNEKKERDDAKVLDEKQKKNAANLFKRFRLADSENATNNDQQQRPTEVDILEAEAAGDITPKSAEVMVNLARGGDAPIDDVEIVVGIHKQIHNAETEQEIDNIVANAMDMMGPNGQITQTSLEKIISNADRAKSQTPAHKERVEYKKRLAKVIGADAEYNFEADQDIYERRAEAEIRYFELTNDEDNPLSGAEAYRSVKEMYFRAVDSELNFLAPHGLIRDAVGKAAKDWLPEDIIVAKQAVTNSNLSQTQKTFQFETIELLKRKAVAKAAQMKLEAEEEAALQNQQNNSSFWSNWFGSGNSTTQGTD
mgnify:FL=1